MRPRTNPALRSERRAVEPDQVSRGAPGTVSFGRRLQWLAEEAPDARAVTGGGTSITRIALDRRSNQLARRLRAAGVRFGDIVAVLLGNRIEFYEACLAIWKLGATPMPVNQRLAERELRDLVATAHPSAVVSASALPGMTHVIVPDDVPRLPVSHAALPDVVAASLKAPTSGGSTGRPKVIRSKRPAVFEATRTARWLGGSHRCHLVAGPLHHDGPFTSSVYGLLSGAHIVLMERFEAIDFLRLIERHRVEFCYIVPTMMVRIAKLPERVRDRFDLSSLRVVLHGAAPCPAWVKEFWIDWLGGERIWENYSTSEGVAATMISGTEWLEHRGSVGRCFEGEIQATGQSGEILSSGQEGLLYCRANGEVYPEFEYIGAESRTLPGGWVSFGDIGRVDSAGYVYITDREADLIISGGANISPAEIEAALVEFPGISSAAVVGLPDTEYGELVHAIVQVPHGSLDHDALNDFLRRRLSSYKLPRSYEVVPFPLRDDAGKVRRSELRAARRVAT